MPEPSIDHYTLTWDDYPPSMNSSASGYRGNPHAAARVKNEWEGILFVMLMQARVPRNWERVTARATVIVPDRRRRDAGNFRMLLEKCLGDILVKQRFLPDDTPEHYAFTHLDFEYEKGIRGLQIELSCA